MRVQTEALLNRKYKHRRGALPWTARVDLESPTTQKDGWQRLAQAATATEEMKPTGQLANPSEWLSNPLRVRRGPGAANAKGSPRESERTERCRKILLQLRALEPERDKTG